MKFDFEFLGDKVTEHIQVGNNQNGSDETLDFSEALGNPSDLPPIGKFVVPGDVVAILLLDDLLFSSNWLVGFLKALMDQFVDCEFKLIVRKGHLSDFDLEWMQPTYAERTLAIIEHDPDDEDNFAYVAAGRDADPIYLNRDLVDADFVLPVCTPAKLIEPGHVDIYPAFANRDAEKRLVDSPSAKLKSEKRLAAEALGVAFGLVVVFEPGGAIVNVEFGEVSTLIKQKVESDGLWEIQVVSGFEFVLATIESLKTCSWNHVLIALNNAFQLCPAAQTFVLLSEIDHSPNSEIRDLLHLQFEDDLDTKDRVVEKAAIELRDIPAILESKSVFLVSNLDEDTVEDLGFGFLNVARWPEQLASVASRFQSGVVLRDAHLCKVNSCLAEQND